MNLAHHLNRSQHYIDRIPINLAAGDRDRAAKAVGRAASHAVTAAAVHWGYPYKSRRRLTTVLYGLLHDGKITHASHIRTFRQVYQLPDQVAAASTEAEARRLIQRLRMRVRRLRKAITTAISAIHPAPDSNPPPPPPRKNRSLRAQLEALAITRPEIRSWFHQWPDLFGDPPPPDCDPPAHDPPPHEPPEWPNPTTASGPGFRWPLPRALPWPARG